MPAALFRSLLAVAAVAGNLAGPPMANADNPRLRSLHNRHLSRYHSGGPRRVGPVMPPAPPAPIPHNFGPVPVPMIVPGEAVQPDSGFAPAEPVLEGPPLAN